MAILNFPDNPRSGDQYTGDNGTTYIFDGVKWVGRSQAQPAGTNSITNNGHTLQIDGDGNVIIPNGSHIYYQNGTALSGAQGPQGVKGDTGDTGTIDIGITTTGVAGSSAEVDNVGTSTAAIFNFTIPRGDKGDRGSAGANGLNGVGDKGDRGDKGDKGDQGVSVTLQGTKATIADLPAAPVNPNDFAGHGWIVTTGDGDAHLDGSLWFWNITDQVWNDIGQIQGPQGLKGDRGDRGLTGDAGQNGLDGAGVATGGSTGQILSKVSGNDFDTHWVTNDRLTAGVVSVVLNGGDSKLHIPGYLLTPYGGLRVNAIDEGLSVDSWGASSLQLTSNGNLNKWVFGVNGILNLPHATDTPYDSVIGATYNINLNANGSFTKFASDGYMEIPGIIRAQQGNDLNLKAYNPTVDGVPGGVALTLQNYDVDSDSRTTQFTVGAQDVVVTTDFSGAGNQWTFGVDGSLSLPTGGNIIGAPTGQYPGLIQLTPYNDSSYLNNGQYLTIYPTRGQDAPHIHIAAGTGGESNGDLILGDDEHYVDINHDGSVHIKTNDSVRGWYNEWAFTSDGTLGHGGSLYVDGYVEASYGNQLQLQGSFFTRHTSTVQFSNADGTDKDTYIANSGFWNLSGITNPNVYGATVYDNGVGHSTNGPVTAAGNNDHTFTFGSVFTLQPNTSYTLDWWEYNPQSVKLNGGENTWEFKPDGTFQLPNNVKQNTNPSVVCNAGVDTVIYTGTDAYQHTFKLLIKVEGVETPEEPWETQSTEMIIAKSFSGKIAASAYGIVHTSADPLATFTARWNVTSSRVEVLCRPTSLTYGVEVRTFATEITTSD
jgi:hypothetical protein